MRAAQLWFVSEVAGLELIWASSKAAGHGLKRILAERGHAGDYYHNNPAEEEKLAQINQR
jgi:hypothetical protein